MEKQIVFRLGGLLRQSAVMFGGNLLMVAAGYGFKIYLARTVGAEGLGLFILGETLITFALLFVTWELHQAVFRFIPDFASRNETTRLQRLLWAAVWHVLLLGGAGALLLYFTRQMWARHVFSAEALAPVLAILAFSLPLRAIAMVGRQTARGYREVVRVTAIETFVSFPLKVIVTMLLIGGGMGLAGWLWGEMIGFLISAVLFALLAWHLSSPGLKRPLLALRQEPLVYGFVATMAGRTVLSTTCAKLSTFLLGIYLTPAALGVYGIAATTVGLMSMLQGALRGVFAPHIAELNARQEKSALVYMYYRVTRWNLLATVPLFVMFIAMAKPLMAVFGDNFSEGALVLSLLAVGELVNIATGPVGTLLTMAGYERVVLWASLGQLVATACLLIVLLPWLGLLGAAAAASVGTIGFYLYLYGFARQRFSLFLMNRHMIKLCVSAICLTIVGLGFTRLMAPLMLPLAFVCSGVIVIYLIWGGWAAFGLLDRNDRAHLQSAILGIRARLAGLTH